MIKANSVDEYIASAPKEIAERLSLIRKVIKKTVPMATEKISYGMPYYHYNGRLVYFAYFKKHIGIYLTPPITELFKNELKDYETHMATIRFPFNKELPIGLIEKLVKTRAELNENSVKAKKQGTN